MINEGQLVYGLTGYVNEITTFGELDCTVLCTQTPHTYTQTEHNLMMHARACPCRRFPKFAKLCIFWEFRRYYILLYRKLYMIYNNTIKPRCRTHVYTNTLAV